MKIALLGGTRFVGPFIVRSLVRQGHEVQVYHREKTECNLPDGVQHVTIDRNVRGHTRAALKQNNPDAVIDMIGFRPEQVEEVIAANLDLEHYVFCSTTAIYGQIGKSTPYEASRPRTHSAYEFGKVGCEELLLETHATRGIPVTFLRLAHPYDVDLEDVLPKLAREEGIV